MISMKDDVIQDLKQFIAATVSQQTGDLGEDLRNDMQKMEKRLSKEIKDLSVSIGETLEVTNEPIESQLKNHEKRITKLERQAT